jgi:hypothetical protein
MLAVLMIMTRLQHAPERTIAEQLRRNCLNGCFHNRQTLQRTLHHLTKLRILRHDSAAFEYVLMPDRTNRWIKAYLVELVRRDEENATLKCEVGKIKDQLFMKGAGWYSWVKIEQVQN